MVTPRPHFPVIPQPRRGTRRVWWAVAAAVVGVLLLGAGAYALARPQSGGSDPTGLLGGATPGSTDSSVLASGSASASAGPSVSPSSAKSPTPTKPPGVSGPPVKAAAGKSWKLTFAEEFSGSDYDHSKLTPCFDWNSGDCTSTFNQGREHYQPSQVTVSGGTAKLTAAPLSPARTDSACQNGRCTYKAGLLSTARPKATSGSKYLYAFTYGYVEARIKFPATQGFFTAFWMLPTNPDYEYQTEIDILELLGDDPSTMFMTYHYAGRDQSYTPNTGKHNNGACAVKDYSKNFVRMGLDWQPDHIAWYIDGKKCGQFTNKAQIAKEPMQLILHMMVDNNWQRRWNVGLTDPTLTRRLEVDYIRVFQQK
ncbi:glycoside hydrolase family 16 protein [Hamadaea sp. NPDC051192]|uniref:glycoside hydrolase family 16 protein n=1 Tax=Hamadaea sp. NPDC051192 TaxID=3154940 RepID=UPI0034333648